VDERIEVTVAPEEAGMRVDTFIAGALPGISRSRVQSLLEEGALLLNSREVKPSARVSAGDIISGTLRATGGLTARPEAIELTIVYQDADLAVIDKPAGLVVHPAPGHESGTLANAVAARFPQTGEVGGAERPGIVHRLDKDTSGLMVVALTARAHHSLQEQLARRTAGREYLALVRGHPRPADGIIDAPIGRDRDDRKRMAPYGVAGRPARTLYWTEEEIGGYSVLRAKLQTGRTHQIRVHFAALGHPVAGDTTYGGPAVSGLTRQFLHATRLTLVSPSTGVEMSFDSPLPPDLEAVLARLRDQP
jgi:23S rRNA pseudouridine1911/1915/1917 synthase